MVQPPCGVDVDLDEARALVGVGSELPVQAGGQFEEVYDVPGRANGAHEASLYGGLLVPDHGAHEVAHAGKRVLGPARPTPRVPDWPARNRVE
jgi:hypothetical protein